ncbi:MAG: ribokinase [Anaerolineaceae bacterium]|nr:ribokinase [Anaerolineaceae bacterium]
MAMTHPKIVVVGSFNADLVMYVNRLPAPGETIAGQRFTTGPGGKGSNQAVAAARLDGDVTFIGRVGIDSFANIGFELWQKEAVKSDYVSRDPVNATGIASIAVEESGENIIMVALGANLAVTQADIDAAATVIAGADVLIAQLETNLDAVQYALETAKQAGVTTILNPAPAAALPAELLALADYLTPNETELQTLTGNQGLSVPDAARSLLTSDSQTVVVTLGAKGAAWFQKDADGSSSAYQVKVVDAVGAGDAFNAGLAIALAQGLKLPEALAFAGGAAAVSVTRPGAAASMPYRNEVDELLARSRR